MNKESKQSGGDERPLVVSLCGTFLKPEMQSVYRQVVNLGRVRTVVFTEVRSCGEMFPFQPLVVMEKQVRPRLRGNFILRFWYKYIIRQWPPPRPINREVRPYYPYNLPDLLGQWQPSLVHVYYGHKAVKYRSMLKAWGGPWIVSFHGVDVVKFHDRPGYGEKMRRVFAEARLVLARSQSLLDKLAELGCPVEKLRLNRTPIPFDGIEVGIREAPEDGCWRFVQASRLIEKKGLFTTLKALAVVCESYPKVKFVLCGDGPVRERFEEAVLVAGLAGNVEMKGWLDQDQLRMEFERAHVFLHPSELTANEDQEGIPNAMLEAMASGLPVIATWHGGIPEAVHDGEDGLLVSEKRPEELAAAMLRMMGEPGLLETLSIGAASSVRGQFGLRSQVDRLENCYFEAIEVDHPREGGEQVGEG